MASIFDGLFNGQGNSLGQLGSFIPAYLNQANQGQYTKQQGNILDAITNQSNPLYQNLYNQNKQQGQENLAQSVAEIGRQNRLLTGMGRSPLLDNERGSETLFRNLTQGYQNNQNQAAQDTLKQLSGAYSQAGNLASQQRQAGNLRAQANSGLGGIIGNALGNSGGIGGLLKGVFGL